MSEGTLMERDQQAAPTSLADVTLIGRPTQQRTAVVEALIRAEGFISAQALHNRLATDGSPVGLTTAYRTLPARRRPAGPTRSATQAANASSAIAPAPTTATTSSARNAA
jgi:hypothetical protein